ncbi:conjugal transfer nickase/helicase domain-containing protein [Photobacterium iliopiscarium]|nr:DNA-binding domain-containing protein [Photobacterium iliopiscarium]
MVGDIVVLPPEDTADSETEALNTAPDNALAPIKSEALSTYPDSAHAELGTETDCDDELTALVLGQSSTDSSPEVDSSVEVVNAPAEVITPLSDLSPVDVGIAFFNWVEMSLKGGIHPVNTRDAFFHIVDGKLFIVSPTAMRTFVDEYGVGCKDDSYLDVQDGIQCMNKHIKTASGRNLHVVTVTRSQTTINGYLVELSDDIKAIHATNNAVLTMNEG